MKKFILTLLVASAGVLTAQAQEKAAPRSEYIVELSSASLEVNRGESKDVTVTFVRSKSFAKSKATLGLSSALPQGVTVTFEPAQDVAESSVAKISVDETAKEGNYLIILSSTLQGKKKGTMLKLAVTSGADDVVSKN